MAKIHTALKEATEEIERYGGKVTRRQECTRHTKVYYTVNGREYFLLVSRGRPFHYLKDVIRKKFTNGHLDTQYT